MSYLQSLYRLRRQLEELSDNLEVCQHHEQRRELLKRMKSVIDETDQLMSIDALPPDIPPGHPDLQ
ncbi:MAG: hypothetical protein LAO19_15400 [Acidobacteriia bacterium]|nr:hypothetical protein [Terriglobia bacterium]